MALTEKKMNQLPAPAGRLWEASIRKLTTIRRGTSAFPPSAVEGLDPATAAADTTAIDDTEDAAAADDDTDSVIKGNDDTEDDDAESAPLGEPSHGEQLLPSGDFYQGDLRGHLPHGGGKFLWTDGSMYEGSWRRGRASGRGKFSWPSGATYEGDMAGGYMHGHGTYIGEFGDTWANNLRHGRGTQAYANGDVYDGHWRDGLQDGHGRYIWRHGHEYIGTWKAGEMHGCGTVIWAEGDRYDGSWEDARPMGQGTFRWADGGMYIDDWCQDSSGGATHAKGVYYPPSGGPAVPVPREPCDAITKLLEELDVCEGKTTSLLPSQKILTWPGVEAVMKPPVWRPPEVTVTAAAPAEQGRMSCVRRRSSVSDMDALAEGEDGGGDEDASTRADRAWSRTLSCIRAPKPGKKQGETVGGMTPGRVKAWLKEILAG